jgi:hypothetical protein
VTTTDESTVRKLVEVVEIVAGDDCEGKLHGRQPCPLESDDQDDWCLPCVAKQALSQYMNA